MTAINWTLVVLLNGAVVVYALIGPRPSQSSHDWFLGGRSLPWWLVGISAFNSVKETMGRHKHPQTPAPLRF